MRELFLLTTLLSPLGKNKRKEIKECKELTKRNERKEKKSERREIENMRIDQKGN